MAHASGDTRERSPAEEFDDFYRASRQRLLAQLTAYTGNSADAQELLADAYSRAWERWNAICGYDAPEAWVRTVAFRLATNRWRKARNGIAAYLRHGPALPSEGPSPDSVALVRALQQISPDQRRAIVLFHLVGLSVEEVARETGAPVGTVKARLARGRAAMAPHLDEREPGDGESRHNRTTSKEARP